MTWQTRPGTEYSSRYLAVYAESVTVEESPQIDDLKIHDCSSQEPGGRRLVVFPSNALTRSVRMLASAGQGMSVVRLYARRDGSDVPEVVRPRLRTQSASCFREESGVPDRRCRLFYMAREWL